MKLFPKLALAVSTLLVGTILCLSLAFYVAERRNIRFQADQEQRAILQNLVHITQESALSNDDLLLIKYTGWLRQWNPSLVSASVVSPQGQILAHSEPDQIGRSFTPDPPSADGSDILVLTEPVHLGTRWIATASARFSEREFEKAVEGRLNDLRRRLAWIAGGAVCAGLLISFILAISWTRPIGSLAQAAHRVGRGDYTIDLSQMKYRGDELGTLAQDFEGMGRDLAQLEKMKEDFVSAVTHELRSPLGAIESYLNLISEEIREGVALDEWRKYIDRLKVNTERLNHFVNDLLDVAALERGKIKLECQPVHLGNLIQ
jgi:signal transduction histidine kinase